MEGGGLRGGAPRDEGVGVELLEVRAGGAAGERGDEVAVGELRRAAHRAVPAWCGGVGAPRGHGGLEFRGFFFLVGWAASQASHLLQNPLLII